MISSASAGLSIKRNTTLINGYGRAMRTRIREPTQCAPIANTTASAATTNVPGQVLRGAEAIRSKESKEIIVVVESALKGDI
jgi:hypothetical protein